ncbi:hypothetical protein BC777_3659 [Yoonia maricola]|uniref:Uncharacterized protein n=1 Tax=Yoonia maricola TaxID=420999 RepID=A0A2M8W112_9RHOB|nr:hypothetical protein BC777_3659 [Yoonia maricola]
MRPLTHIVGKDICALHSIRHFGLLFLLFYMMCESPVCRFGSVDDAKVKVV